MVRQVLLVFVLISIGFALGKEAGRRSASKVRTADATASAPDASAHDDKVIVYYLYGAIRCVTCNTIEATAKEVIETKFAQAIKDGRMEWKTANFQEDEELAKRYNIASSTLVLVERKGGKDVRFEKLEEAWTLVDNKPAFVAYVENAIKSYLEGGKK